MNRNIDAFISAFSRFHYLLAQLRRSHFDAISRYFIYFHYFIFITAYFTLMTAAIFTPGHIVIQNARRYFTPRPVGIPLAVAEAYFISRVIGHIHTATRFAILMMQEGLMTYFRHGRLFASRHWPFIQPPPVVYNISFPATPRFSRPPLHFCCALIIIIAFA